MVQFERNHPCIHTVYNGEKGTSLVFTSLFYRAVSLDVGHRMKWGVKALYSEIVTF